MLSTELSRREEYQQALKMLDESIEEAVRENQTRWITTLSHHAAVIADFSGNQELVKHYYEQSLAHDCNNPRALYGLATIAREQGELKTAREYAARCQKAIVAADDEVVKKGLIELIAKHWPDIAER